MIRAALAMTGLILLLSGCAAERVVLLPDESGESGSLAIFSATGEEEALLDRPYSEARIAQGGGASVGETSAEAVDAAYGTLIKDLPPPPRSFTLYFKVGTTTLTPESEPELERLLAEASERLGGDVQVVGHTDTVGAKETNDELSEARAQEVKRLLVERGLDPALVRAVGRGEREPLVPTGDEVAETRNRRVEVLVR